MGGQSGDATAMRNKMCQAFELERRRPSFAMMTVRLNKAIRHWYHSIGKAQIFIHDWGLFLFDFSLVPWTRKDYEIIA